MSILATYPSANSPSWPPCPGTFGTFGQHCPKSVQNGSKSAQNTKSQHVEIWGCQFWFWFRMVPSNAATGYVPRSVQNLSTSAQNTQSQNVEIRGCQFWFWFRMVPFNAASGYVAKISMSILATHPSANSPSWPPCPGMFGTLFGAFGKFGTSGTFGTFLDPRNIVRVQHRLVTLFVYRCILAHLSAEGGCTHLSAEERWESVSARSNCFVSLQSYQVT